MTLLMAVPLVAILGYVAYARYVVDDAPADGWKTYRNDRFKYEMRIPAAWVIELEYSADLEPGRPTVDTRFSDKNEPSEATGPFAVVRVNPRGDWCVGSVSRYESREITVGAIKGQESVCYITQGQLYSVLRDLMKDGNRYWIIGEVLPQRPNVASEFEALLKMVQRFRFVD